MTDRVESYGVAGITDPSRTALEGVHRRGAIWAGTTFGCFPNSGHLQSLINPPTTRGLLHDRIGQSKRRPGRFRRGRESQGKLGARLADWLQHDRVKMLRQPPSLVANATRGLLHSGTYGLLTNDPAGEDRGATAGIEAAIAVEGMLQVSIRLRAGQRAAVLKLLFNFIGANWELARPFLGRTHEHNGNPLDVPGVGGRPSRFCHIAHRRWRALPPALVKISANARSTRGISWGGGIAQPSRIK